MNDDLALFSRYMELTGTPSLEPGESGDPALNGKRLGLVNGANWISLFCTWFARRILPGVQLIQVGNEAVQLNFMRAHRAGLRCPPQVNIDLFVQYSEQLVALYGVDAILITCSTMNRAAGAVRQAMEKHGVPVVQIDEAMMEFAVKRGGRILVVATHGPTVRNTQDLLRETAERMGLTVEFEGATIEDAFHLLGRGDVEAHNRLIANAIREAQARTQIDTVVLAQLSMAVFELSYPDALDEFGIPVLTSGRTGMERVRELLLRRAATAV